jgi:hypothetical protein
MTAAPAKPVSKTKLLTLVKNLDWRAVKAAVKEHPDVLTYRGDRGASLLHVCCGIDIETRGLPASDSIRMAGVLLDASLDINEAAFTEGDWKATPLWYVISRGKNLALAKYLLGRGASPEHCMWAAAYNNDPPAIRLLVRAGASVDVHHDDSPFLFAIKWSHFAAAKALLDAGANVNLQDRHGKTALHYMLKKRSDPKHIRMLLDYGARLDLEDRNGVTAGAVLSRMRTPAYQAIAKKR